MTTATETTAKPEATKDVLASMNPAQRRALRYAVREMWRMTPGSARHTINWKEFSISRASYDDRLFWIYAVTGSRTDEGTVAALLCRNRWHFTIGPKGGITVYGLSKNGSRIRTGRLALIMGRTN